MDVKTESVRTIDVPLGVARATLRLIRSGDELMLCQGFGGSGAPFDRPSWAGAPLQVPASLIPELRKALAALDEVSEQDPPERPVDVVT